MLILDITSTLVDCGYLGMGIASFLAGGFIPFSSEAILSILYYADFDLITLIVCASVGNVAGSMLNYFVGRLCKEERVYKIFRVKPEKLEKSKKRVKKYGIWMGLLSWIPIFGSCVTIAMGVLHTNIPKSIISITIGKVARYIILGYCLYLSTAAVA